MVSILTMSVTAIINALIYVLKAVFSLILWFFNILFKGVKVCFSVLPVTTLAFVALLFVTGYLNFTGQNPFPEELVSKEAVSRSTSMMSSLRQWWVMTVFSGKGKASYYLLLFLSVLMFLPVMTVFLSISVFLTFGRILFLAAAADLALYIILTVFGKSFMDQILDRYYRLFPDAGIKHEKKTYARLLRKRNRELQENMRRSDFYNDSDSYSSDCYYEDGVYEEYDEEEYDSDEEFEDAYGDEGDFYEDYEYEDEEYYPEEYDEEPARDNIEINADMFAKRKERSSADNTKTASANTEKAGGFDFFAGCNSKESVDKKYKSLVKLYHPDNMDGDTAALQEINIQYTKAKKRFEA